MCTWGYFLPWFFIRPGLTASDMRFSGHGLSSLAVLNHPPTARRRPGGRPLSHLPNACGIGQRSRGASGWSAQCHQRCRPGHRHRARHVRLPSSSRSIRAQPPNFIGWSHSGQMGGPPDMAWTIPRGQPVEPRQPLVAGAGLLDLASARVCPGPLLHAARLGRRGGDGQRVVHTGREVA